MLNSPIPVCIVNSLHEERTGDTRRKLLTGPSQLAQRHQDYSESHREGNTPSMMPRLYGPQGKWCDTRDWRAAYGSPSGDAYGTPVKTPQGPVDAFDRALDIKAYLADPSIYWTPRS